MSIGKRMGQIGHLTVDTDGDPEALDLSNQKFEFLTVSL